MWHAVKKQYFSITEKWKAPTILYLSYSRNLFLCAHIIQFLDPNFGPAVTILLSTQASIQFSYSYDKCHHTPLAHALGYIGKGCKMRAASRITANLLLPNFWAKKSNILTWILHIFVGWKVTFRFHQCYQNTLTHSQGRRALAGETVLAEGPLHSRCPPLIPASAAKFTHWNPSTCFLPALN